MLSKEECRDIEREQREAKLRELQAERIANNNRERRIIARVYLDIEALKNVENQIWLQMSVEAIICEIDKGEHKGASKLLVVCEAEEVYQERLRNL